MPTTQRKKKLSQAALGKDRVGSHLPAESAVDPLWGSLEAIVARSHQAYSRDDVTTSDTLAHSASVCGSSQPSPAELRKDLALSVIEQLKTALLCDRVGILVPSKTGNNSWQYIASEGFPDDILRRKDLYVRGKGLTGQVLTLKNPLEHITSDDVEQDPRWSRKSLLSRPHGEEGPLRFIAVPLFCSHYHRGHDPYGGIVCCRFAGSNRVRAPFTQTEITLLAVFAQLLGSAYDVAAAQSNELSLHHTLRALAHLWTTASPLQEQLDQALQLIQQHCYFRRLLFSLVTPDRRFIKGAAVAGFHRQLISDTVRRLHSEPHIDPTAEDILSVVVRENRRYPTVVRVKDTTDPYSKHVHTLTAGRHDVTNTVVFQPIRDSHGAVVGVLMGELPPIAIPEITRAKDRIVLWAELLAWLLHAQQGNAFVNDVYSIIRIIASQMAPATQMGRQSLQGMLRGAILQFCSFCQYSRGLAYIWEPETKLLRGVAAVGFDEPTVQMLSYSFEDLAEVEADTPSLACAVFRSKAPRYAPRMDKEPVSQADRKALGIQDDDSALGIPLLVADQSLGVIILIGAQAPDLSNAWKRQLLLLAGFIAAAVRIYQAEQRLQKVEALHKAEEVCIGQVAALSLPSNSSNALNVLLRSCRKEIDLYLAESSRLVDSELAALYTPDQPIHFPPGVDFRNDIMTRYRDVPFFLRAHKGYRDSDHVENPAFTYSAQKQGLTSTVIQTLQTQYSDDVEGDPRWSGFNILHKGLRAWVGAPVVHRDENGTILYGILTFTRERSDKRDARIISHYDILIAERLAQLLAVALHSKYERSRTFSELRLRIMCFLHHARQPFELIRVAGYAEIIRWHVASSQRRKKAIVCRELRRRLDFISACFLAISSFGKDAIAWWLSGPATSMGEIWAVVHDIAGLEAAEIKITPPDKTFLRLRIRTDRHVLIYVLYSLLHNAVKACREGQPTNPHIRVSGKLLNSALHFTVEDNGCGISVKDMPHIFQQGVSFFKNPSSGLGLTLVKRLIEAWPSGSVHAEAPAGGGAIFRVVLPNVEEEQHK